MIRFENILLESCEYCYTGKFHIKLWDSQIVNFDRSEKIIPKKEVIAKKIIPVETCLKYIRKLIESSFYGDINVFLAEGKIYGVEVCIVNRLEDLAKYLSEH